jgi:dihydrodipicolinate synthase/N-acetylneuraminate lyase
MALLMKSDMTPEEMKELAKKHGIKLSKEDMKLMTKMKKQNDL